jgi:uncharacterized membrane protein YdjX (TVP38/TMEM64 family)
MFQWFEPYMKYLEPDFWFSVAEAFKGLGPIAPIFLAFIESIIPALPLLVIITFNTSVYGPVLGFIYSWVGTTAGAIVMFSFYRFIFRRFLIKGSGHLPKVQKAIAWVGRQPASTLFIITAIPFTPSSAINLAYGLSDYSKRGFIKTTILGKLIMVLSMTLFGTTFNKAFENPFYIFVAIALLILLIYIAGVIKKRNHLDELE